MTIDGSFSSLCGAKLFPILDVKSSYYSITVAEDSRKYTAFTAEYGKYKFLLI